MVLARRLERAVHVRLQFRRWRRRPLPHEHRRHGPPQHHQHAAARRERTKLGASAILTKPLASGHNLPAPLRQTCRQRRYPSRAGSESTTRPYQRSPARPPRRVAKGGPRRASGDSRFRLCQRASPSPPVRRPPRTRFRRVVRSRRGCRFALPMRACGGRGPDARSASVAIARGTSPRFRFGVRCIGRGSLGALWTSVRRDGCSRPRGGAGGAGGASVRAPRRSPRHRS
jgi:hypothetical protein